MNGIRSITWRLAFGLAAGATVLWIAAAFIAGLIMQNELDRTFDYMLEQSSLAFRSSALRDARALQESGDVRVINVFAVDRRYFDFYIVGHDDRLMAWSEGATVLADVAEFPEGYSDYQGRRALGLREEGFLLVLLERAGHRPTFAEIGVSVWPLAALIPLIAFGIALAVRFSLRPVKRLGSAIAQRGANDLSPLPQRDHPVEFRPIIDAVGDLTHRLKAALDAERAFAARSAHELRTPIAAALAKVQRLRRHIDGGVASRDLAEAEASLRHLAKLSERVLQMSQLEAGFATASAEVDLLPILEMVVREIQQTTAEPGRVRLHLAEDARLQARVNPDAFAIAARNLIDNALVHGKAGAMVEVFVEAGSILRIVSDGEVVPVTVLQRLGQPFARVHTGSDGVGLGLSIVRSIAEQTGGALSFCISGTPPARRVRGAP